MKYVSILEQNYQHVYLPYPYFWTLTTAYLPVLASLGPIQFLLFAQRSLPKEAFPDAFKSSCALFVQHMEHHIVTAYSSAPPPIPVPQTTESVASAGKHWAPRREQQPGEQSGEELLRGPEFFEGA